MTLFIWFSINATRQDTNWEPVFNIVETRTGISAATRRWLWSISQYQMESSLFCNRFILFCNSFFLPKYHNYKREFYELKLDSQNNLNEIIFYFNSMFGRRSRDQLGYENIYILKISNLTLKSLLAPSYSNLIR